VQDEGARTGQRGYHDAVTATMAGKTADSATIARRGDVVWFRVTDACNAHCVFCAEHVPRATDDLRDDSVLRRFDGLLAGGVPASVLFTGGEPTVHPKLPALLARARDRGVQTSVLYTNGFALGDPRILSRLRDAGLGVARISLFGVDDDGHEATRHPRAWQLASGGIDACIAAEVPVQVALVVNAITLDGLPAVARQIVDRWPTVQRVIVRPYVSHGAQASSSHHVAPRDAEKVLAETVRTLAAAGIVVSPEPGYGFHLCAFARPRPVAAILRHGQPSGGGQHVLLPGCEPCALRDRCGGVERTLAAHFGDGVIEPIIDKRRAAWLPVFERTRASDRTDRITVAERAGGSRRLREQVIRILHACNQRCAFCWVDFEAGAMTVEEVRAAIVDNMARGGDEPVTITYTGGEPTLHKDIIPLVQQARELGAARVHIQTNAVRCANPTLAGQLADAGLDEALVSLHAADAESSDALTAAPGTFARTVEGIRNLCDAGVDVVINHVLTSAIAPDFPTFVRFVADTLRHDRLVLTIAVAGKIDRGPLDDSVLPRLSELAEPVREGLLLARDLDVNFRDVVHPCGLPPCVLGGDCAIFDIGSMRKVTTEGVAGEAEGCVKPASCRRCVFDAVCYGVRREYADDHGTDELIPIDSADGDG